MAAYRNIYQFSIVSQNGDDVDIFISKKNYAGVVQQRSLGRAPILKRERNGNILGTSLEIYAECKVDGEFSQLYTSSADEFRVEVYRNQVLQWTGFVSPELYSEPDIAPPYDVQIIATDGLGELKNYDFVQGGNPRSFLGHLNAMLAHTSLDLGVEAVSSLEYYDDGWSGNTGMMSVVTDMSHREGEDCYEVLQSMLSSVNAVITQQEGKWMVIRESDMHALAGDLGPVAFGAMTGNLWWPVGNLSTDIIPAKKSLTLISENHYKATVLDNSQMNGDTAWTKEFNALYDAEESAYRLPVSGSAIRQKASFYAEVGYRLLLHISARNIGSMEEPQMLGVIIKIDGRMYQAGSEFWLGKRVGYEDKYLWSNTEKSVEVELPASSESDTRSDAQDIDIVIPLYKYDNRSYAYATAVEVSLYNVSGDAAIAVYGCSLSQYDRSAGNKIAVTIGNDAREDAGETDLAFSDGEYALAAADVFRNAIPLGYDSSAIIKKWRTPAAGEGAYLSVMASDYAMQVALPRMRYRGKLNVPSVAHPVIPMIFERDSTYYFLNTYSYDLLNDELEVELISIPNASVVIESETITELPSAGSLGSSSSGSSGGGGTSGGGGGSSTLAGLADVQVGNAQNGQALVYENGYWVPRTVSGGGSLSAAAIIFALGYTPLNADSFTKANIKNALGIKDWALAANKPSYSWSEIGSRPTALSAFTNDLGLGSLAYKSSLVASDIPSLPWSKITSGKPTTLSGYGITDAMVLSGYESNKSADDILTQGSCGIYEGMTNTPDNSQYGSMLTFGPKGGMFRGQLYIGHLGKFYVRSRASSLVDNSYWRPWREVLDNSNYSNFVYGKGQTYSVTQIESRLNSTVIYSGYIDITNNDAARHIGYGYAAIGWKNAGPAMSFGTALYNLRMQLAIETSDAPRIMVSQVYNGTAYGWAELITYEGAAGKDFEALRYKIGGTYVLNRSGNDTMLNYGNRTTGDLYLYGKNLRFSIGGGSSYPLKILNDGSLLIHDIALTKGTSNSLKSGAYEALNYFADGKLIMHRNAGAKNFFLNYGGASEPMYLYASGYTFHIGAEREFAFLIDAGKNARFAANLTVGGNIIGDVPEGGTYQRYRLVSSGDTMYLQVGAQDGTATTGKLTISGINVAVLISLTIYSQQTSFSGAVQVNGTSRFVSLATFDAGLKIGDATLTWDATAGMLKIDKGVYSEGAITAKKKA